MVNSDIQELKEKLKKGTISYFSLSPEEIQKVKEELEKEIKSNKEDIENIKEKVETEKRKLENNNL